MKRRSAFPPISTASSPARPVSTGPDGRPRRCASRRGSRQNEAARLVSRSAQLLHAAVVESCDPLDGVKDGVIENPKRCTFDPGVLECKGADDGRRA